jgi:hypothetical protein
VPTSSLRLLVLPALKFAVGLQTDEREKGSQVSDEDEVELKCFWVLEVFFL